jgi:effector-binding domain-containing protein
MMIEHITKNADALDLKICGRILATVKQNNLSEEKSDIEFLVPVDKEFASSQYYVYKQLFRIVNAIKLRHEGDISSISDSVASLENYIEENKLSPITGYYFCFMQAPASTLSNIIDIYVGINVNAL